MGRFVLRVVALPFYVLGVVLLLFAMWVREVVRGREEE